MEEEKGRVEAALRRKREEGAGRRKDRAGGATVAH